MKSILKLFASNVAIAALGISCHTYAQNDTQQLCLLNESQLNTELSHFTQLGGEHLNNELSSLDTQCQPTHDRLQSTPQEDRQAPKITAWQLSSNEVNISTGEQTVTLTIRAYDESGIDSVYFGILPPNRSYPIPSNRIKLEDWTATSEEHVYEASGSLTLKTDRDIGGIWRSTMMFLRDKNGYYSHYTSAAALKEMGFDPYIAITNDAMVNVMAPQLRGYALSRSSVDVSAGQKTVNLEVLLHDESGIQQAIINVIPPEEYRSALSRNVTLTDWQATQQTDVYKATAELAFNPNDVPGSWRSSISYASDTDGKNSTIISNREIQDYGFTANIEVINSNDVDTTPPELVDLTVSKSELNSTEEQQQVTVKVKFTDPSGLQNGYISLVSPTGNYTDDKVIRINEWQSTDEKNVFIAEATFTFDKTAHAGAWLARSWLVEDKYKNLFDSTNIAEYVAKGINPYIFVNVAHQDIKDFHIAATTTQMKGRLNKAESITLNLKDLTGKTLPEAFSISVFGNEQTEVNFESISGTAASNCEFLNGSGNCKFNIPKQVLESDITFNLTATTTEQNTVQFRFVSDEPELKLDNNQFNVSIVGYEPKIYTVKFVDWDGTVLATAQVEEGETPSAPSSTPTRSGYTFTGWDQALSKIAIDTTFTAQYEINKYQVVFKDWDGTVLKEVVVNHGQTAADFDRQITREGYTFTGWDHALDNITENLTITAQYEINKYQVTFKDWDGKELAKLEVEHGSAAVAPESPTRVNHVFTGWDKSFEQITSALSVTAQYTKVTGQTANAENNKTESSSSGSFGYIMSLLALLVTLRRFNRKA